MTKLVSLGTKNIFFTNYDDFLPRWPTLHLTWVHPRLLAGLLTRLQVCVVTPVTHARAPLSRHMTPLAPSPGHRFMPLTTPRVYVGARVTIVTIPGKRNIEPNINVRCLR